MPWFLAGTLFPITALPGWLEAASKALPLTHALAVMRYGLLDSHGAALHHIWGMSNVTAMAAATKRPGQVVGLHFFNPVPLMKLVEVVRTILTDDTVAATATEWIRAVGKVPYVEMVHRDNLVVVG